MKASSRLRPLKVSKEAVLSKAEYFSDLHLWSSRSKMNPQGWLKNFTADEELFALNMLNIFLFYCEPLVDALFLAAIHSISVDVTRSASTQYSARALWKGFLSNLIVTYVEGEDPNPTDSGYTFARKARQILGLDEKQIMHPKDAINEMLIGKGRSVLFVDDFVGRGNQMKDSWYRQYKLDIGGPRSFHQCCLTTSNSFFYAPLVSTKKGYQFLQQSCPGLDLYPAHILEDHESLVHADSVLWPKDLRSDAADILYGASVRAGIVDEYTYGWKGFGDFGLAIAFWNSVPDATLPLYFWDKNDWIPLVRRT